MSHTLKTSFSIALALCMAACATASPTPTLQQASNAEIAQEYQRRRLELLRRPPPKRAPPESDTQATQAYLAEVRDENTPLGKYVRQYFADHLVFADAHDARSLPIIASAYWDGWFGTVEIDPCKSLPYAFQSARLGQQVGMTILAEAYLTGRGLPQDHQRAVYWALELEHNGMPMPQVLVTPPYFTKFLQNIEQSRLAWPTKWNKYRDLLEGPEKICLEKPKE